MAKVFAISIALNMVKLVSSATNLKKYAVKKVAETTTLGVVVLTITCAYLIMTSMTNAYLK